MFGDFRADPDKHKLRTPSGRIELYSEKIAGFGYDDCPPHPTWIEPWEWLGGQDAKTYPLHLISSQPRDRLHSQMDCGPVSAGGKVAGREAIRSIRRMRRRAASPTATWCACTTRAARASPARSSATRSAPAWCSCPAAPGTIRPTASERRSACTASRTC